MKIFKYTLEHTSIQTLELPKDAKILSVQNQNEVPCLWALVNTDNKLEKRVIEIVGTGQHIENRSRNFISTAQFYNRTLVFHFFELI